jgi:catechol 2,3-dioxygenase-like lactoylglutathione lyase family enzyme
MLTGLNHITLAVSDLDRALDFYTGLLGMKAHVRWQGGAYLSVGELWLCLSVDDAKPSQDYSHIAFAIAAQDFPAAQTTVRGAGVREWKTNRSEGDSLYILDPDGHKLEIHCGDLHSRLEALRAQPYAGLVWLN